MTVKILTEKQKEAIATIYKACTKTQKDIAKYLGVSARTVNRVLQEKGLIQMDTTKHLLNTKANKEHLERSLAQLKNDEVKERSITTIHSAEKIKKVITLLDEYGVGVEQLEKLLKENKAKTPPFNNYNRRHNHAEHLLST